MWDKIVSFLFLGSCAGSHASALIRLKVSNPGVAIAKLHFSQAITIGLHLTFKYYKFKTMNVVDMIPASGKAAELLRSLSHPQRLLVLCALGENERSVAELRELLSIDQVPMSQHLMRLRADGLVEARRVGTTVYYRITRPEVLMVVAALHSAFCPPQQAGAVDKSAASAARLTERSKP